MHGVLLLQAIDSKYTEAAAKVGPDQEVTFENDNVSLDIRSEGLVLENGWTITPYTHPGVSLHYFTTTAKVVFIKTLSLPIRSQRTRLTILYRVVACPPVSFM